MSTQPAFINLFPAALAAVQILTALAVVAGPAFVAGAIWSCWRRRRRRQEVAALGRSRGLSPASADFLGQIFQFEGRDTAEFLLSAPDLFRRRLGQELRTLSRTAAAESFALRALELAAECGWGAAPFVGAPRPFERLHLHDPEDPRSPTVPAWVVSLDERSVTLVSRHDCPWPTRRSLRATRPPPSAETSSRAESAAHAAPSPAAGEAPTEAEAFTIVLLLRPAPPACEWLAGHDLVDVITNRRAAVRVPCALPAALLPESGDCQPLRERLVAEGRLDADDLRLSRAWTERHAVTVADLSPDGAKLLTPHPAALRQRFHLALRRPDGVVVALPLLEVVSCTLDSAGRHALGTRFLHLRIKERLALAEFVRETARAEAQSSSSPSSPPPAPAL